ncbi:MAG TPA: PspC domain-containing protein [Candidatus Acidoferrales bacterium]|nr:PspC domain-containing protein [Candidatus Acidoferrales bacterium]
MSVQSQRRFERPQDRVIAGVCHGLGDYFDIDPVLVRIVFVILTAAAGSGLVAYVILWIVMPPEGSQVAANAAGIGVGIRTMATEMKDVGRDIGASMSGSVPPPPPPPPPYPPAGGAAMAPDRYRHGHVHTRTGAPILGLALVAAGIWLLLGNFGLVDWDTGRWFGPLVLVALGLAIVIRRLQ